MRRRWANDLAIGVRLAIAGGRTSVVRLALTAVGMGLGVVVLLFAAALPTVLVDGYDAREQLRQGVVAAEQAASGGRPTGEGDLLAMDYVRTKYRGLDIKGALVAPTGPGAPLPPGLDRLPRQGELVVSPALDRLLDSPDGALLRPRFAEPIVGVIGDDGLTGPQELFFYGGGTDDEPDAWVRAFEPPGLMERAPLMAPAWILAAVGATVLLVPVLVFVAATARIGAAARDRRLAAIRLVGADARQIRRIAAGEAVVGGVAGVLVGDALFLALRPMVESVNLVYFSVFAEDVRPPWFAVAAIVVGAPALAVLTTEFALRRVALEPLGLVRRAPGLRRRVSWRLLLVGAGLAVVSGLAGRFTAEAGGLGQVVRLAAVCGAAIVIFGVSLVLPALVERVASRLRGGPPSWQLGIRRLQLDGGTTARMLGGVAALLAGVIAMQGLLASMGGSFATRVGDADPSEVTLYSYSADPGVTYERLNKVPGVRDAVVFAEAGIVSRPFQEGNYAQVITATCPSLTRLASLPSCAEGDVFVLDAGSSWSPRPGETVLIPESDGRVDAADARTWQVPASAPVVEPKPYEHRGSRPSVLATPEAFDLDAAAHARLSGDLRVDPADADVVERVRNAVAFDRGMEVTERARVSVDATFGVVKRVLMIAALVVLALAAASLLVLSLEQLRERRRPLSMMVAAGCRRSTLAASLLWQTAVTIVIAAVLAVGTGAALAALLQRAAGQPVQLDWPTIALLAGSAVGAVLAVTALTLPWLARLTRPDSLRTE